MVEDRQLEQSLATQKYVSGDAANDAQTLRMVQPSRVLDMLERFVKSPWPLVLQYDNLVRWVVLQLFPNLQSFVHSNQWRNAVQMVPLIVRPPATTNPRNQEREGPSFTFDRRSSATLAVHTAYAVGPPVGIPGWILRVDVQAVGAKLELFVAPINNTKHFSMGTEHTKHRFPMFTRRTVRSLGKRAYKVTSTGPGKHALQEVLLEYRNYAFAATISLLWL